MCNSYQYSKIDKMNSLINKRVDGKPHICIQHFVLCTMNWFCHVVFPSYQHDMKFEAFQPYLGICIELSILEPPRVLHITTADPLEFCVPLLVQQIPWAKSQQE